MGCANRAQCLRLQLGRRLLLCLLRRCCSGGRTGWLGSCRAPQLVGDLHSEVSARRALLQCAHTLGGHRSATLFCGRTERETEHALRCHAVR